MPREEVTANWAENELNVGGWHVWLKLVVKVNPDACEMSAKIDAWLGSTAIAGGSISDKEKLVIEARCREPPSRIEEVDEDDPSGDSEDGAEYSQLSPSPTPSNIPQPSLIELYKPQD